MQKPFTKRMLLPACALLVEMDVDRLVTDSEIGMRLDRTILYVLHKDAISSDPCRQRVNGAANNQSFGAPTIANR
jgi:hypothetical protein